MVGRGRVSLTFFRHPRVDAPGLCYGRTDVPLAPGAEEAIAAATLAAPRGAARLLTSPAARCQDLAHALAETFALAPQIDPRLHELDFGAWEGRAWTQIPRAQSDPWAQDPITRAPPGGETFAQLQARVRTALTGQTNALVVTHAGPIRAWQILTGRATFQTAFARPIPYARPIHLPEIP